MTDAAQLSAAVHGGAADIVIRGVIGCRGPLGLGPGQSLRGADDEAALMFRRGGLVLTRNNRIANLSLRSGPHDLAVSLEAGPEDRGTLDLADLRIEGRVQLIFGLRANQGRVRITRVALTAADATGEADRPWGNGVEVVLGAMTIWNRATARSCIDLEIDGLALGAPQAPVRGTGLFIAGAGDGAGGVVRAGALSVGPVYADSGLPPGTTHAAAGGVFILTDAEVDHLACAGPLVTHGANAVPVDNWGRTRLWTVTGDVISHGPSAIGVINAGHLGRLEIQGRVETFGQGARGCSIYGPTGALRLGALRTHGAAATGVQIVDRLESLEILDHLTSSGDPGEGLVKGVMVPMPADGVHIETSGDLGRLSVGRYAVTGRDALAVRNDGRLGDHGAG
ncbi:hypothetical protein [Caulobacter sp. AP07]|uniref:hypothetical protein n=1 Tax=Caulobacter sp. AP07 TaxID=1144304 RepID=UPI000306CC91|nr:hypothetical protein [Caulobacter sp. AP07]